MWVLAKSKKPGTKYKSFWKFYKNVIYELWITFISLWTSIKNAALNKVNSIKNFSPVIFRRIFIRALLLSWHTLRSKLYGTLIVSSALTFLHQDMLPYFSCLEIYWYSPRKFSKSLKAHTLKSETSFGKRKPFKNHEKYFLLLKALFILSSKFLF